MKYFVFCSGYSGPTLFFEIYKRSFHHAAIVALSKYVIRCCLPSDFVYYYQIPPFHHREDFIYLSSGDGLSTSVPWELH